MANVYVDLDLATGLNDGSDWTNAYQSLKSALTPAAIAAGDVVWVKGSESSSGTATLDADNDQSNPVIVLGVKSATTNEPPVQSDLIPGWRTGESRTEANLAQNDGDAPVFDNTSGLIQFEGWFYIYGVNFVTTSQIRLSQSGGGGSGGILEECGLTYTADVITGFTAQTYWHLLNCDFRPQATGAQITIGLGHTEILGGYVNSAATVLGFFEGGSGTSGGGSIFVCGLDVSDAAHTLLDLGTVATGSAKIANCALHASSPLSTGTPTTKFRYELIGCSSVTGKTSGSVQNFDVVTNEGTITEESTAVRTGGATDGEAVYSIAFTPNVDGTRDQYWSLPGPWLTAWVEGDGTSSTLTCYIANSGAGDYNDDDVYLEVLYPSEGGTAQHTYNTNQMELLDTPAAVTDDTGSTWGTGGNNPQKLQVSIAPDYSGLIMARVHFAKNFSSSPETLFVDPELEVA